MSATVHNSTLYEVDDAQFDAAAYSVSDYAGIAWRVYGWEMQPDVDTEWTGIDVRTGRVIAVMIGDDRKFAVDPDDLTAIPRESFCGVCGQIGCSHDGLDRG